jgi:hypothetical protein
MRKCIKWKTRSVQFKINNNVFTKVLAVNRAHLYILFVVLNELRPNVLRQKDFSATNVMFLLRMQTFSNFPEHD